ncbi:kelch domain-containing protein 1-like isoform X5 [Danio rerio]
MAESAVNYSSNVGECSNSKLIMAESAVKAVEPQIRERSGHAAAADRQHLYIWGGYASVADQEQFLPRDEIWIYDLERGSWCVRQVCGSAPPPLSGSSSCLLDGELFIFGGCSDDGQTNELYSISLGDGRFTCRRVTHRSGSPPSPRDKLCCWLHEGRIVFFGGYGPKLLREVGDLQSFTVDEASWADGVFWGWNNETHQFDPERRSWTEVQTTGGAPAPRAAHASATIGCKGFICGGRVKDTRTSDLHCLDFSSWTWSEIVCSGASPTGRSWHTLTAVSHTALFLFGGLSVDCRPMSDVWIFNLETNHWMKMKHKHTHRPRLWHTASAGADADVVVFGGSGDNILLMDT